MKKILLVVTLFACYSNILWANSNTKELPKGYFMVLAAYAPSAQGYAIKYVDYLKEKGIEANYGISHSKNLIFVYSVSYSTRSEAIKAINSERERTGEPKAWVYVHNQTGMIKKEGEEEKPLPVQSLKDNEKRGNKIEFFQFLIKEKRIFLLKPTMPEVGNPL